MYGGPFVTISNLPTNWKTVGRRDVAHSHIDSKIIHHPLHVTKEPTAVPASNLLPSVWPGTTFASVILRTNVIWIAKRVKLRSDSHIFEFQGAGLLPSCQSFTLPSWPRNGVSSPSLYWYSLNVSILWQTSIPIRTKTVRRLCYGWTPWDPTLTDRRPTTSFHFTSVRDRSKESRIITSPWLRIYKG